MMKKYLPIGSVVLLKNAKKKLIIIGLLSKVEGHEKTYDYTSCIYPVGIHDSEHLISFNHEDIEIIYSLGYMDDEYFEFNSKIKDNFDNR